MLPLSLGKTQADFDSTDVCKPGTLILLKISSTDRPLFRFVRIGARRTRSDVTRRRIHPVHPIVHVAVQRICPAEAIAGFNQRNSCESLRR